MIKAHEIQGCIALENSFNKVGLDHVVLVKVASTAVVCGLLGLEPGADGQCDFAGVGGWAEFAHVSSCSEYGFAKELGGGRCDEPGGATGVDGEGGEMGYPSALTAKTWGFYDVSFKGQEFKFQRPYGSYVMENVLFKISFPAEFHAQTAVEAAMTLRGRLEAMGKTAARYSEDHDSHA